MASEDVVRALHQIGGVGQWLDMVQISGQHLKNKDNVSTTGLLFDTLLKSMRHCVELMETEKENQSNGGTEFFIFSQNLMLLHEENENESNEKKNVSFQEKVANDKDDMDEKRRCVFKKNKTIPLNSKEIIQAASPMKKRRTSSNFYSIRSKYQPLSLVSV